MIESPSIAHEALKSFIERIERLKEEKKALSDDIKDIFAEAKSTGFDPKIMKELIKLRKMDENDRAEQQVLLDIYMNAMGMTPMEEYAKNSLEESYKAKQDNITIAGVNDDPVQEMAEGQKKHKVVQLTVQDDLYDKAVAIVLQDKKCSTSYIQRQLKVGYNKAAGIVERMEVEKLVSPADGVGKRTVNIAAAKRAAK